MSDELGAILKRRGRKESADLARLLTRLEEEGASALRFEELMKPKKSAVRIGITGPPGAGKSTLISGLIHFYRKKGLRVGVMAVDPSSPFSNGAVLGDRIRYQQHFLDPQVFIRSLATRGGLGGLTASAYLMARAFEAWEFDVLLIETVGVGQTELEVMYIADYVIVTLVPESGDSIQAMKAGLLEIADLFVVNKSDRPGSEAFARELRDSLALDEGAEVDVLLACASEGVGIHEIGERAYSGEVRKRVVSHRNDPVRLRAEARALLQHSERHRLEGKISKLKSSADLRALFAKKNPS